MFNYSGNYRRTHLFMNLFAILIAPFSAASALMVHRIVEGGGGSSSEMTQKEAIEKIKSFVVEQVGKANSEMITREELDKRLATISEKAIKELNENSLKDLKEQLIAYNKEASQMQDVIRKQGEKINELSSPNTLLDDGSKSFFDLVYSTMKKSFPVKVEKNAENETIERIEGSDNPLWKARLCIPMGAKAAVDMTTANVMSTDDSRLSIYYDPQGGVIPNDLSKHVEEIIPSIMIKEKYYGVAVEHTETDGTQVKAEGSAAGQSSFLIRSDEFKVFTFEAYAKISRENMEDLPQLAAEVARVIKNKLARKFDELVITTGGDNSTSVKGALHSDHAIAIDFANTQTSYKNKYVGPTIVDVLDAVKSVGIDNDYDYNFFVINNVDLSTELSSLKDADNNSIDDRRVSWVNGLPKSVLGMTTNVNKKLTVNRIWAGDRTQATIAKRRDIVIDFAYDGHDFTNGLVSIRASFRAAYGVKNKNAFAYVSSISQAITDLTAAGS
jgi:hypothetical protein